MAECRFCGAQVRFVTMRGTGKAMPIDPIPTPSGNVIAYDAGGGRWHGYVITADTGPALLAGRKRYLSHMATCPSRPSPASPSRPSGVDPLFF